MTLARRTPLVAKTPLTRDVPLKPGAVRLQRKGPIARTAPLLSPVKPAERNTASRDGIFPAAGSAVSGPARNAARTSGSGKLTPPAPSEFSAKVKRLVRRRAGRGDEFDAACEAGGEWLGIDAGEFQHRAARGAGGCRGAVINGPANCCLMCPECHRRAESRDPHMGMDEGGFWLEHGTTPAYDPRLVPILLMSPGGSGIPVFLAEDGLGLDGTGYLLSLPLVAAS